MGVEAIRNKSALPLTRLESLLGQIHRDLFICRWLAENIVKGQLTLPKGIDNSYLRYLYIAWLHDSFEGHMCWYLVDEKCYVEGSAGRMDICLNGQRTLFINTIREIQIGLQVPLDNVFQPSREGSSREGDPLWKVVNSHLAGALDFPGYNLN